MRRNSKIINAVIEEIPDSEFEAAAKRHNLADRQKLVRMILEAGAIQSGKIGGKKGKRVLTSEMARAMQKKSNESRKAKA